MVRQAVYLTFLWGVAPAQTGKPQATPVDIRTGPVLTERKALGGKAIRKQATIRFSARGVPYSLDGPQMHLLLYLPVDRAKSPVFLGLNLDGNQSVNKDPGILANDVWVKDPAGSGRVVRLPPDDATRGARAAGWQVEKVIAAGYGLATVCYGDIEPDFDGGQQFGVRSLLPDGGLWKAAEVWAWGIGRAVDFLRSDPAVDGMRIAVFGQARLVEASLRAAAQDPRITMVVVHEPGRDVNELMSLIAPRPVFASGTGRAPPREVNGSDWDQYLAFANAHQGSPK